MKYKITTLGCKVNRFESEAIALMLKQRGFSESEKGENVDVFILNSCTVTAEGDRKVRQLLRRERSKNPSAVIVLTGCMAQAFPEKSAELSECDIITGTVKRNKIPQYIFDFINHKNRIVDIESHPDDEKFEQMDIDDFSGRTRAYIKIQDGCNRFCSYCIIPYARGRSRSVPPENLKSQVKTLAEKGFKEIVLTGINLSWYGKELGLNLCDAVNIACQESGIERVRLGSLEPEFLSEEVIKNLSLQKKLCPQFHISLQSGCDSTLKRMRRTYTNDDYFLITENIRKYFKNPAITTDIMVGFPDESDEEFLESYNFVEKVSFSSAHVFSYSIRPGTKAADMENQVKNKDKELRSKKMIALTDKSTEKYHSTYKNQSVTVLFETQKEKNLYLGYTDTYVPVLCVSPKDIKGEIKKVYIDSTDKNYCYGRVEESE